MLSHVKMPSPSSPILSCPAPVRPLGETIAALADAVALLAESVDELLDVLSLGEAEVEDFPHAVSS